MSRSIRRGALLGLSTISLCSFSAQNISFAQTQTGFTQAVPVGQVAYPTPVGVPGPVVVEGPTVLEPAPIVVGKPYRAEAVTTIIQALSDGSHITHSSTAMVARDAQGRTVRVQKIQTLGLWTNQQGDKDVTITTIFDPVTNSHIDYTSNSDEAHVVVGNNLATTLSRSDLQPQSTTAVLAPRGVTTAVQLPQGQPGQMRNKIRTEPLGGKQIDGIEATGSRTTTIIPAGTIGNDKDLLVTSETWLSPDLKIVVSSKQDDPRFGETRYEVRNIVQGTPDPGLFQIPAGYKVEKIGQ